MKENSFIEKTEYNNFIKILNKEKFFSKSKIGKNKIKIFFIFLIFIIFTEFILSIISLIINIKAFCDLNIYGNPKVLQLKSLITTNKKLKQIYKGAKKCLENNPDTELCLYQFLCPKKIIGKTRILVGEKKDGSYVMLDDFENITIAYSIGISDSIHFDKYLADKGIDIYMYDHTIDKLPFENDKFHFKKIGIGGNKERAYNIKTLNEMLKENKHSDEKNMILKIDVEGSEWDSLNDASEDLINQFKYILIEYHFYDNNITLFYNVLKKVYKTHQIFYIHCNPSGQLVIFGNNGICSALEVSYIIRNGNSFSIDKSIYPIPEFSNGLNREFNDNIFKLFDDYDPTYI